MMYRLALAVIALTSAALGVGLGLAAVPVMKRVMLADRPPVEWGVIE